jgi:hypothetical protein
MYRLKDTDIECIIVACKAYQQNTGSEYMWERYETIVEKLNLYREQNLYAERVEYPN